jgi:hypothetical protein
MENAVPSRRAGESGFSLVEALIAALLLLIIVVGLMPLFSRAMLNNTQGNDATRFVGSVVDDFERLLSLPFDSRTMSVPPGETEVVTTDFYLLNANRWVDTVPSGDRGQYERRTTVRQFNISDLLDNGVLDSPMPGDATPSFVHLKVVDVRIEGERTEGSPPFEVRVVQAF